MKFSIKNLIFPGLLLAVCLFLISKSYTPDTFLSGWDTLHPEFDFALNFKRLLFGVWRSEQGLGAAAGHSHMADLPRVLILWVFHFFLPLNLLRYAYVFLCLLIGPLGFFYLAKHLFKKPLIAFIGALLYLFNLSTVQQFYVPFEMFPTQWALLPLLILFSLKYLTRPSKKDLIFFLIATFFSTPQSYAAHLWYPYFGLFALFLFLKQFLARHSFKPAIILLSLTLAVNSFWLLPNLYYIKSSGYIPNENKSNRLHSQEFLLKNRQTGTLIDVGLIKGFYFNWDIFDFDRQQAQDLMPQWNQHLSHSDVLFFGFLVFNLSLIGLILSFKHRKTTLLSLSPFYLIPFILLGNRIFPLNYIFDLLLKVPLLQEAFRFIFTKVSILFSFALSLYFTAFTAFFSSFITSVRLKKILSLSFILALFIFSYPLFTDGLISPKVKITIPTAYSDFWGYMKDQPQGRILSLPLHEPSGWQYYNWGYQGSGLTWFGLNQPLMDRDFDRWQYQNEQAYREFFHSLYSNNPTQFNQTLEKFKIKYILWDKSSISTSQKNPEQITFQREIEFLLGQLQSQDLLYPLAHFDHLSVFTTHNTFSQLEINQYTKTINPSYHFGYFDYQYQGSDYISDSSLKNYYPFRSVLTNVDKIDPALLSVTPSGSDWQISLPGHSFTVTHSYSFSPQALIRLNPASSHISPFPQDNSLQLSSHNSTGGLVIPLSDLTHDQGYIIGIESRFSSGVPLRLCFKNLYTGLCSLHDQVSTFSSFGWNYFLVPPFGQNQGYELHLNSISYGSFPSQSYLKNIVILPLPYQQLSQIVQNPQPDTQSISPTTPQINWAFPNLSLISLKTPNPKPDQYITLYQSYSPDWLAFYLKGLRPRFLDQHLLVNNWANAWLLPSDSSTLPPTIYIIFWPQLLQFIGFGLLTTAFIFILLSKDKLSHN